jgi:hypothetical protein
MKKRRFEIFVGQRYVIGGFVVTVTGVWVRGGEITDVDVSFCGVEKMITIEEFNSKERILIV